MGYAVYIGRIYAETWKKWWTENHDIVLGNVQTEGTKCKGLETGEGMCDMFEKQPKADVERLRVVRDEVVVVGRSNETGHWRPFSELSFYFEGNGKLPGFESRKDMIWISLWWEQIMVEHGVETKKWVWGFWNNPVKRWWWCRLGGSSEVLRMVGFWIFLKAEPTRFLNGLIVGKRKLKNDSRFLAWAKGGMVLPVTEMGSL